MSRVTVLHAGYGCDTGCCGHVVEVDGRQVGRFEFDHPSETELTDETRQWVKDLVTAKFGAEHVADIDWDEVVVSEE